MAVAARSPLASSVEKTNGAKLSRLLIDGGTTVLRNVFDSYHPPANLAADLNANYLTLNNLLKKRVLLTAQWDQLFPPGGATPDSKAFDITLLFLLLTNICGLTPPLSGWHTKPPPSDTSLESNLTRIKFFRNELYGHVTTTGVNTLTFNALWVEISAVLVALGLNQAEIDKLKAEHCGEKDFLDVLLEWADSEEDIKSQLTKTQQRIAQVRHTQLEVHKTLDDSKAILEEVHQAQTNIQGTIERVCHAQLEDHEKLQHSKSKLEEVLHHSQTITQETVEGVAKSQEKHFEAVETGLEEIKQAVGSLKGDTESQADKVLKNLAKTEFKGDIKYHVGRFQEDTREWVFNKVQEWLDDRNSQNRVMVISANAGMGKSVISAVICKRMQEAGRLSGSHFCQHNNARYRNPQLMLQSLACHLCHALPEYKQALVKQLSRNLGNDLNNMGVEELFALLFKEPLSDVADPGRNMLMVIDGLDESEFQERNELLDVIANHFCKLPCWIRFLCTTRPERNIAEALRHLKPFQLESNDEMNLEDIKRLLKNRLQHVTKPENLDTIVEKLAKKSEGLMLYAYFLVLFIEENKSVLDQGDLDGGLPLAISSVYRSYFKRLENELSNELGVKEEHFLNLLCAVTASREPLPIAFVSKLLVPNSNSPLARRKVLEAIGSVSSLLPIRDGCLHVIHKSVKDWLTDTSCYGEHDFIMDEKEGHRILASVCTDELDDLKQKGVHDTQFSSTKKYALCHGARHLLQLDEDMRSHSLEECVQTYVIDLELLYAKLCSNDSRAAEDILWLQKQDITQALSENSKGMLNTLIFLLRKYFSIFTTHPQVFLQTVLNEGGTELSPMASNLLQNKYPEVPYMEFVHKQMQQGAVQAHFQCSSEVICFDVSPQLDYMVCECKNGTIQLWSLHTGKLVWVHPVMINKSVAFRAWRKVPSSRVLSHYRSVVFHPTAEIVLPGVLSHAFTVDGDLKSLFPESNCSFTVCSVSGSKASMLTDCPDDARCIIMWSLMNGSEISRTTRNEDVLSFAWSQDGRLLAISHSKGLICLADVVDGFITLAEITTPEVCGMIKFAPDERFLYCRHKPRPVRYHQDQFLFCLNVNVESDRTFSLDVFYDRVSHEPWKSKSRSEGGFLLGDPLFCVFDGFSVKEEGFAFVLNEQSVLISYPVTDVIEMLSLNELTKGRKASCAPTSLRNITSVQNVTFSLNGETIYVVSSPAIETISVLDISSGELKAEKSSRIMSSNYNRIVPVREGVLFTTRNDALELWNFQLSESLRMWPIMWRHAQVIPISEQRVAYRIENVVTFLDTASGEVTSIVRYSPGAFKFVTCNSKCQVIIISDNHSLQLSDGKVIIWCRDFPANNAKGLLSPSERFLILMLRFTVYVLDAVSGKTLHILCRGEESFECKFVSDEICAITSSSEASKRHNFLRLFNVKSGDQLTVIDVESKIICLDSCPHKHLIAIGLEESKFNFKLIQVKLPREKGSRKSQR